MHPETRRGTHIDTLHGHIIADPYRWLEDPDAPETRDWVDRQAAHTEEALAALPGRRRMRQRLTELVMQPKYGTAAFVGGRWYIVAHWEAENPQEVWTVAETLDELEAGRGRVLLNPNTWSDDGTSALSAFKVSPHGRRLVGGRSDAGSDWQHLFVLDMATGETVEDAGIVTKFCDPVWLPDEESFVYRAFEGDDLRTEGSATDAIPIGHLKVHRVGTAVSEDVTIWRNPGDPQHIANPIRLNDDGWLGVYVSEGTERHNKLYLYPVTTADGRSDVGEPVKLVDEFAHAWWPLRVDGDRLIVQTDADAPRHRIVSTPLDRLEPTELVAERQDPQGSATACGDGFAVEYLVDCAPTLELFAADGASRGTVAIQGGTLTGLNGSADHDELFVGMSSIDSPMAQYRVDVNSGEVRRLAHPGPDAAELQYSMERVRATSADGTEIPYFLIRPAEAEGPLPTIVYGYGGFSAPIGAWYSIGWHAWLEAGGAVAVANLRGGGEFGRDWYFAGRRENKQNVFDDAIAVAEHLLATGAAPTGGLSLHGRSNGGLLVGAVMTQRPDLFGAVAPAVGVLDMLRFHKFTGGALWRSDYGDPDVAADFEVALKYSPLHNVREGVEYPATIVITGDHDDRVVPLHSHKFTAALQHAQAGDAPILTRIDRSAGHGAGKPRAKQADEWADMLTFLARHTGLSLE